MLRRHKRVSGGVKVYQKMKSSFFDCFYVMPPLTNGGHYKKMIALANKYIEKENVDALILACTELPLAIKPEDVNVPIVNTTQVHINAIYQYAIR